MADAGCFDVQVTHHQMLDGISREGLFDDVCRNVGQAEMVAWHMKLVQDGPFCKDRWLS